MYEKFAILLKNRRVSAYEVSKKTGVLQSTLSDWKNKKYVPKVDKLKAISDFFEVPLTYFLEDIGQEEELHETAHTNG